MTIYFSGIRLNEATFNPTLDDPYDLKRDLQARAERSWGEAEEALKESQRFLGFEPPHGLIPGISRMESAIQKHIHECPLAGAFVGRYKVKPIPETPGHKLRAYTCSDYLARETFKTWSERRHGLRSQICAEGEGVLKGLVQLRKQISIVKPIRDKGQHGRDNWTKQPIGECLNRFSEFLVLKEMAFSVHYGCLQIATGNHVTHSFKPDFYRSSYSSDEVRVYAKERSESFDFARKLERRRDQTIARMKGVPADGEIK